MGRKSNKVFLPLNKQMIIETNKYYSLLQIHKLKLFNWINSYDALKRWVKRDIKEGNKLFKVIRYGEKTSTRYLIKGERILELIEQFKDGKLLKS